MGTTLDNGIYLPDEGERNCYDGLAGNWVALDNHLGSTDIHVTINDKQAWNGHVADTTIHVTSADKQAWNGHIADSVKHVTAEDKQAWNGKADASALTAHTGDTTIHVTAEDKAKWDAVTSKADNSDVVHKSGDETINGNKTFTGKIYSNDYYYGSTAWGLDKANSWSNINTYYREICISGDRAAYIAPMWAGAASGISFLVPDATKQFVFGQRTTDANNRYCYDATKGFLVIKVGETGRDTIVSVIPFGTDTKLGDSTNKWKSFNGLEPSSLSLPSGNLNDIIDISSYLTDLTGSNANTYLAPANGWISITMSNCSGIQAYINGLWGHQIVRPSAGSVRFLMPILKDKTANILIFGGTIDNARFIPCQGNV